MQGLCLLSKPFYIWKGIYILLEVNYYLRERAQNLNYKFKTNFTNMGHGGSLVFMAFKSTKIVERMNT